MLSENLFCGFFFLMLSSMDPNAEEKPSNYLEKNLKEFVYKLPEKMHIAAGDTDCLWHWLPLVPTYFSK